MMLLDQALGPNGNLVSDIEATRRDEEGRLTVAILVDRERLGSERGHLYACGLLDEVQLRGRDGRARSAADGVYVCSFPASSWSETPARTRVLTFMITSTQADWLFRSDHPSAPTMPHRRADATSGRASSDPL